MAKRSASAGPRGVRVAEQIHQELALLIRGELKDAGPGMITLTGVDLTPDYAYATVYFTVLPDDPATVEVTTQALSRAAGFMRGQIGRRIRIHTTPELRFVLDRSTLRGLELDRLISEANRRQADE
ncbi:MAG: 30S ribosome-binding factor RbfA [Betaproteobacteria bacterium]|nr:30S ribosome-binding factor RbfA [Betaproteobacteria bacterium]